MAAWLRKKVPGLEIKIVDMAPRRLSAEQAAKDALEFEPEMIGISAMSFEAAEMFAVADKVKQDKPELVVVAGGPHASTSPGNALQNPNIDYVVRGEGEITGLELIKRVIEGGRDPAEVSGLAFRKDGEARLGAVREQIVDMDSLPLPAYDLIDLESYWDLPRFGTTYVNREYATLSTSRACPYRCTYCHRIFGTRYRSQSPEKALRDMAELKEKYGVRELVFVDDCFNLDKKRVAKICDGMAERGLAFSISFPNGLRGDIMDRQTLERLKEAGTYRITYAVETASPRMQKFIKKNVKLDKLKHVIEMTDRMDIMVDGFFMVGFPGETRQEIEMTLDYALSSRLHTANFWFVTPFQGTELYQQAEDLGLAVHAGAESLHYFDPRTDLSEVPADELKKMVKRTFRRFYLNPWRMKRIWRLFPNKRQLPSLLVRFLKISATWKS